MTIIACRVQLRDPVVKERVRVTSEIAEVLHNDKSTVEEFVKAETFQCRIVWEGEVEVFNIRGHPKASLAYAWSHETDKGKRYIAVLELPPVDSAQSAVRAAIVDEAKRKS